MRLKDTEEEIHGILLAIIGKTVLIVTHERHQHLHTQKQKHRRRKIQSKASTHTDMLKNENKTSQTGKRPLCVMGRRS